MEMADIVWLCGRRLCGTEGSHSAYKMLAEASLQAHSIVRQPDTMDSDTDKLQAELPRLISTDTEAWLIARIKQKSPELAAARRKAKIRPERPIKKVDRQEWVKLWRVCLSEFEREGT